MKLTFEIGRPLLNICLGLVRVSLSKGIVSKKGNGALHPSININCLSIRFNNIHANCLFDVGLSVLSKYVSALLEMLPWVADGPSYLN